MTSKKAEEDNPVLTYQRWLNESIFDTSKRLKKELPQFKEKLTNAEHGIATVDEKIRLSKSREEIVRLYSELDSHYGVIESLDTKSPATRAAVDPILKDILEGSN